MTDGIVYTETVVHSAPEKFVREAPYQLAIVEMEEGRRVTGRILGGRVAIGDRVRFVESREGVPYFSRE